MKKNKKFQSGFGLVEVIVSITIMVLVVLVLSALSRSAYYNWENASNKAVAYNLIQEEIEILHNIRDTNIATGKVWDDGIISVTSPNPVTIENRTYSKKITVEDIPTTLGVGLKKKVTVEVKWQERLGERSLVGWTYLTDWKPKY